MEDQAQYQEGYREEALELLVALENALMGLEDAPADEGLINLAFRQMHTLKGSGAMFGFAAISSFTHDIETAYDLVRTGKTKVTQELIELTLNAKDEIIRMLRADYDELPQSMKKKDEITKAFRELIESCKAAGPDGKTAPTDQATPVEKVNPEENVVEELGAGITTYRIRYKPSANCFLRGTTPLAVIAELISFGKSSVAAHTCDVPFLDEYDPDVCYTRWDILVSTEKDINKIRDVFIFEEDTSEVKIEVIDVSGALDDDIQYKKLGEILIERGDLKQEDLDTILGLHKKLGELLVENNIVDAETIESAIIEQEHVREAKKTQQAQTEDAASIRVPADRLDTLVNLVGELVTVQAHLTQMAV
ncbi:MAG: Hpt domain-containing protein, partial [Candidatus Magnetominusculus sp. LBB02]|nr:Hpt domain-containing protein [Candidatus Magnetominusculus sp. LBB02]